VTSGANSLGSTPRIDGSSLRETGHRQFLALLAPPDPWSSLSRTSAFGKPAVPEPRASYKCDYTATDAPARSFLAQVFKHSGKGKQGSRLHGLLVTLEP